MAKFGFLSVLEEELDKHLDYDFAMDWESTYLSDVLSMSFP